MNNTNRSEDIRSPCLNHFLVGKKPFVLPLTSKVNLGVVIHSIAHLTKCRGNVKAMSNSLMKDHFTES